MEPVTLAVADVGGVQIGEFGVWTAVAVGEPSDPVNRRELEPEAKSTR